MRKFSQNEKWALLTLAGAAVFAVVMVGYFLAVRRPNEPVEVRARHILIKPEPEAVTGDFEDEEERAAAEKQAELDAELEAKDKAEAILVKLRSNPDAFADLAREESDDTGSAEEGGDVGWFGYGRMVPEFETAAFDAAQSPPGKDNIVGPVKTDFGYHIIQIIGRKMRR